MFGLLLSSKIRFMESNNPENRWLSATQEYVRQEFGQEGSGHDWWHIHRVHQMAVRLWKAEGGDRFIIEMAALLHDLDDWKLCSSIEQQKASQWLTKLQISPNKQNQILEIIEQVSFKGAGTPNIARSKEAQIVQDADRLDAIGAIGIARSFAYGGNKNRLIYHPESKPEMHTDFSSYQKSKGPTINHFYEKLLLLKDQMNTSTARKIAENRHRFMELFLAQFFNEWDGKK